MAEGKTEKYSEYKIHKEYKRIAFEKCYKPFIKRYSEGIDLYSLIGDEHLKRAFRAACIKITDLEIKDCICQMMVEGEE